MSVLESTSVVRVDYGGSRGNWKEELSSLRGSQKSGSQLTWHGTLRSASCSKYPKDRIQPRQTFPKSCGRISAVDGAVYATDELPDSDSYGSSLVEAVDRPKLSRRALHSAHYICFTSTTVNFAPWRENPAQTCRISAMREIDAS
jgi:hypothetical protein